MDWPATISPRLDLQVELVERHLNFQFGDGYEQRTPQGVNPWKINVSCNFTVRGLEDQPTSKFVEFRNFFISTGMTTPFNFDIPGIGVNSMIFRTAPRFRSVGYGVWDVSVEIESWNTPGVAILNV